MNKNIFFMKCVFFGVCLITIIGCDARRDKIIGPYKIIAIDTLEQTHVAYDLGDGTSIGRIPDTVASIGFNDNYIVAIQHPGNNKHINNYWFLDIKKDSKYGDPKECVVGPLNKNEYYTYKTKFNLPEFTKTYKN